MAATQPGNDLQQAGDRARDAAENGWAGLQPLLDFELLHFAGLTLTVGGLIAAILALVGTWALSALIRRAITHYGEKHPNASQSSLYTVSRVVQYLLLAIGLLLALSLLGVPVGKFTVIAGAIGVGLGFGLQAIFSNFISGLILLFDKSLKVGDFVELESGVHGEVRDIKIRATTVVTNDNIDILVPNSEFVTGRVVSWTHREVSRRLRVPFNVAYGTDKETVKTAALEAACEVPFTLAQDGPRRPQVWLAEFGDSSLNYELVVWLTADATKRPAAVKAAYNWALHSALARYELEIPFPQRDLHIRSVLGLRGEEARHALRMEDGRRSTSKNASVPSAEEASSSNDAAEDVQHEIAEDQAEAEAVAQERAAVEAAKGKSDAPSGKRES